MMKKISAILAVSALTLVTACGGSSGRPSVEEVSASLTSEDSVMGGVVPNDEFADCFARVLVESDLSDDTLNAIVEQDESYEGSDADREELGNLTSALTTECADEITGGLDDE